MVNATPAPSPRAGALLDGIARQQQIENALSAALHLVRQSSPTPVALQVATARAVRAATLLKHACETEKLRTARG